MIKTLLAFLILGGVCTASDFVFKDGYYWLGENAYTRQKVSHGHYGGYRYEYRKAPVVVKKEVEYKDRVEYKEAEKVDWRTRLLEIAQEREEYRAKQEAQAQDHREYMEALKALGLEGNAAAYPGYSHSPYGYQANSEQGTTVYGYSYSTLADIYGDNVLRPGGLASGTRVR